MRRHHPAAGKTTSKLIWIMPVLAILSLLAVAGFIREFVRSRQIDREIGALQQEAERLRIRNFEIARLQSSLDSREFLERQARLKLGLRKDGEQVVVLRKTEEPEPAVLPEPRETWSNPKKWFMYFADRNAFNDYVSIARGE